MVGGTVYGCGSVACGVWGVQQAPSFFLLSFNIKFSRFALGASPTQHIKHFDSMVDVRPSIDSMAMSTACGRRAEAARACRRRCRSARRLSRGAGRASRGARAGTASTHAERTLPAVVVTVSVASIVVHVDAPNYRPPSTNLPKKEREERRHAKAIHAWQSGAHQLVEEQLE